MSKVLALAFALSVPLVLAACTASTSDNAIETSSSSSSVEATESVTTGTGAVMDDMIDDSGSALSEDGTYTDPMDNARD